MTAITKETVLRIAGLAKINLTDDEATRMTGEIIQIASFAGALAELDTEGVAPMSHAAPGANGYREDAVVPSLPRDEVLANAPERDELGFLAPKVVD